MYSSGVFQKLKLLMFNVEVYNHTSSPPPPTPARALSLSLSLRHNEASAGERDNTCKERKALKYKQVIQMSMHARKALKVFLLLLERLTTMYTAPNSYVQVLYICEQLIVVNVHVDQLLWVK